VTKVFAPVLTFAVFSVRARDTGDVTLDTARVFTSLSLFALLSDPLASLVMALASFMGAAGSFVRIQKFLESDERADTPNPDEVLEKPAVDRSSPDAITVQAGDFGWDPTKDPLLKYITMSVPWQRLTMVVGPVGCGKSTLMQALLGEVPSLSGSVRLGSTSIAYCSQDPWHMNGSVKEAIVGCEDLDEKWYDRVVYACALKRDFKELPMGDSSRIGSGGIALSGGQSQRIVRPPPIYLLPCPEAKPLFQALARAVYARRKITILDDVLSGLDNTTEHHVFHNLLGAKGILREMRSTVMIASSSGTVRPNPQCPPCVLTISTAKRLPYSDHIVCLGMEGEITAQGTFADLNGAGGYVSSFSLPRADWTYTPETDDEIIQIGLDKDQLGMAATQPKESGSDASFTLNEATYPREREGKDDASRRTGDVQIYLYYVKSVGWFASLVFVVAITGFVFCISFPSTYYFDAIVRASRGQCC
jgi:ABC-type Mn2+/Zn2+ transport system ATPase subunit